jgi:hypothetical protein
MVSRKLSQVSLQLLLVLAAALPAMSQSCRVQCPAATAAHPRPLCMHLSGGDGFVTMADAGTDPLPTYIFGFSSLCRKANGSPFAGSSTLSIWLVRDPRVVQVIRTPLALASILQLRMTWRRNLSLVAYRRAD